MYVYNLTNGKERLQWYVVQSSESATLCDAARIDFICMCIVHTEYNMEGVSCQLTCRV